MNPQLLGNRIKEIMKDKNITIEELSKKMEINKQNLEKKLKGEEEFYLEEMHKIKEIFNLSLKEVDNLFFKEE